MPGPGGTWKAVRPPVERLVAEDGEADRLLRVAGDAGRIGHPDLGRAGAAGCMAFELYRQRA